MSEQEKYNTPEDTNQQVEKPVDVMSLKKINMTISDYNSCIELEPDDPRLAEFLEQYNIEPGEPIIVSVTSLERPQESFDCVVAAGGRDSFTTNYFLTNELGTRLLDVDASVEQAGSRGDIKELGGYALDAVGVEASAVAGEREKDPFDYLHDLLPPVTRPENRALTEPRLTRREQEQQKYYDRFVTKENKQLSQEVLAESLRINPAIGRVLQEAGINVTSIEAVDVIRENADVRYEVARYFAQKLEAMVIKNPQGFGVRIEDNRVNNLKEDPQTGQKMMSRDYVVSLVLKMLGGEYSERHADNWFDRNDSGRIILGLHRDAARMIMNHNA